MERILLYYPAINIPNGTWLRNSILYTDKVSSIFPFNDMHDVKVNDDMRILCDEGLYKPIYVFNELQKEMYLKTKEFEDFENNFIETINSDDFKKLQSKTEKYYIDKHKGFKEYGMYLTKLTKRVKEYLIEKNLFKEVSSNEAVVEYNSAIVYMSMLADYLANKNKSDIIVPSTDDKEYQRIAFQLADNKIQTNQIIFENCLPTPAPNVSLKKIIKFKQKRHQELLKFRKEIDKIEKEIISSENNDERKLKMVQFEENYKIEVKELVNLYGDSKLELVGNTFSSLLDFKEKDLSGLAGSIAGLGLISSNPFTGIPGIIAGSVALVMTVINSYKKMKRKIESNSYSYLYYAQNAGVI